MPDDRMSVDNQQSDVEHNLKEYISKITDSADAADDKGAVGLAQVLNARNTSTQPLRSDQI